MPACSMCTHWYAAIPCEGRCAAVSARWLAVRLCGCVDSEGCGVLRDRTGPRVVLPRVGVFARQPVLRWRGRILRWSIRLSHGFWGSWGLLVTLEREEEGDFISFILTYLILIQFSWLFKEQCLQ